MVSKILIPKTEEIRHIDNIIPSYEEFMKTYQSDDKVNASYESEINSYGDLGVEKGYGPCIDNGNLNYDNCHCSSDELDRQLRIIRNKRELEISERGDPSVFTTAVQPRITNNLGIVFTSSGETSTFRAEGARGSFRRTSRIGDIGRASWTTPTNFLGLMSGPDYTDRIEIDTLNQLENMLAALNGYDGFWHDSETEHVKEKVRSLVEECKRGGKVAGVYSFIRR